MKRYIAFVFASFDHLGGWGDVVTEKPGKAKFFDSINEAVVATATKEAIIDLKMVQVVDLEKGEVVQEIVPVFTDLEFQSGSALWFDYKNDFFVNRHGEIERDRYFQNIRT